MVTMEKTTILEWGMREVKHQWSTALIGLALGLSSMQVFSSDLMSVYQLALENDDVLKAMRNENAAVLQVERQKKGLYYPSLGVGYDHIETNQVINRSDNEVFGSGESDFPTDVLSLNLKQPIFRLDYYNQRKLGKAEVSQADYLLSATEQELMLRSAESYLLTLAALDNEYVTKTEGEVLVEQLKLTQKRLDVGLAYPAEVYESSARVDFNQAETIATENEVVNQKEGLRVITGVAINDLVPLKDDFEMVPPVPADQDSWISQALENNLGMKSLEAALEVATAEYKLQKSNYYPTIDFVASFNNRDSGGSLFGGGSDVDTTDLMVQANWQAFQGGIIRARVKEAFYLMQSAEDKLELKRANVRRDTRNAYLGVVSSIAKAKALKSSMEAQRYTALAKRKGFETGTIPNIQVLDAERDFFFVQRDYLKARYQYLLSLLRLKQQVGTLSPDDLKMINGMLQVVSAGQDSNAASIAAISYPLATETAAAAVPVGPSSEPLQAAVSDSKAPAEANSAVLAAPSIDSDESGTEKQAEAPDVEPVTTTSDQGDDSLVEVGVTDSGILAAPDIGPNNDDAKQ